MHITIIALGSHGDVFPFALLGGALRRAGHDVRLATFESFAPMAADQDLDLHPVGCSSLAAGSKKIALLSKRPRLCGNTLFTSWLLCLIAHICSARYASFFPLWHAALYKKEKRAPPLFSFSGALPLNLMSMPVVIWWAFLFGKKSDRGGT